MCPWIRSVDHERRHAFEEIADVLFGVGRKSRLLESDVHKEHPAIARGLRHGEGNMAHAQAGMPALFVVGARPAPVLGQEEAQTMPCPGQVAGPVQRREHVGDLLGEFPGGDQDEPTRGLLLPGAASAGEPYLTTLEEFAARIRADYDRYGKVIAASRLG